MDIDGMETKMSGEKIGKTKIEKWEKKMIKELCESSERCSFRVLDFRVWKEERDRGDGTLETQIHHEFYEKPMASKLVMMEKSALPQRMKITTLTAEIIRREKNTSRSVGEARRRQILSKMMVKMKRSGYDERMRRRVLVAGRVGYKRMVQNEEGGGRKVNRPRWDGEKERRLRKIGAKSNWYKKKKRACDKGGRGKSGKGRGKEEISDIEAVLFVPYTPRGELAKLLQEEDDKFRRGTCMKKIKVVERGGITIKDILCRTNPWASEGCDRRDCLPCKWERGRGGNCQQESVVYVITCMECEKNNVRAEYTGETSRTAFLRGREHIDGLEKENEDNALWKHCHQKHDKNKVNFRMKVLRGHRSPLTRQVQEGVEIDCSKAGIVMNSKGEWNGSRLPRIRIEIGDDVVDEEEDVYEKKNNVEKKLGQWEIKNMSKRKRVEEESAPISKRRKQEAEQECGPAKLKYEARNKIECGPVKPQDETRNEQECGQAESETITQTSTRKRPKCGPAKPNNNGKKEGPILEWLRRAERGNEKEECGLAEDRSELGKSECSVTSDLACDGTEYTKWESEFTSPKDKNVIVPERGLAEKPSLLEYEKDCSLPECSKTKCGPACTIELGLVPECGNHGQGDLTSSQKQGWVELQQCETQLGKDIAGEILEKCLEKTFDKLGLSKNVEREENRESFTTRGIKRKMKGQPSIRVRKRRRKMPQPGNGVTIAKLIIKELIEKTMREVNREEKERKFVREVTEKGKKFAEERNKMSEWLKSKGKVQNSTKPGNTSKPKTKLEKIRKENFKKIKNNSPRGHNSKGGEMGEKVKKITEFLESFSSRQNLFKNFVLPSTAKLVKSGRNSATDGWRGEVVPGWGVGVVQSGSTRTLSSSRLQLVDYSGGRNLKFKDKQDSVSTKLCSEQEL